MSEFDSFFEETKEKISVLPNVDKKSIESLLESMLYSSSEQNETTKAWISDLIETKYTAHVLKSKNPVMKFPSEEEASDGFLKIGYPKAGDQVLGYPFLLSAEDLRQHCMISARAGFGKTTLLANIVDHLVAEGVSFLAFDFKRDFRSIAKKHNDVKIIRAKQIRFNPLCNIPENCNPSEWRRQVWLIFSFSQGLFQATTSHIQRTIEDMLDNKDDAVTFYDVLKLMESNIETSKKNMEYTDVAVNRLFNLTNALGDILTPKVGWNIQDLFSGHIVIEVDGMDFPSIAFFSQCLLMHEYMRRLANNIRMNRNCTLEKWFLDNHVEVIMTEAHNMQGQENSYVRNELGDSPLVKIFSQARETSMGFLCESQFYDNLMDSFKLNCATKIIGGTEEASVQRNIADSIGLDKDDYKILGSLKKGNWICNISGRSTSFVLGVDSFYKGDLVADAEILERSSPFINEMTVKQQQIESKMFLTHLESKSENANLPQLSKDSWLMLEYIFHHHFAYQSEIKDSLQLAYRRIMNAKNELQKKRLIVEKKFPVIVNDRTHFAMTPEGLEVMKTIGKTNQQIGFWKKICGRPGYQHSYWIYTMWGLHRKLGWKGQEEYVFPNGRRVDLRLVKGDYVKIIEYENSTIDVINKVRVLDDVSELVLLYKNESELKLARSKLEKIDGLKGRLWIGLDRDYLALLRDILKASEKGGNMHSHRNIAHDEDEKRRDSGESKD